MKGITWELRDYDREFFTKELEALIPNQVFDAHAHLYEIGHWGKPHPTSAGPSVVTLEEYRRQMSWLMPRREISGLFFGVGFHEGFARANDFVAREIAKDACSSGEMIVPHWLDAEEARRAARQAGFIGFKVYHTFSPRVPTWNSEISDFLTEEHVRVAAEEGWVITLHLVKRRALADPGNQAWIERYCRKYRGMRLILAHAGRGFNAYHTVEGIHSLSGLPNVWCDMSGITEAPAIEAIVETLGHERLLWGSDFPISHLRGRCVAIGDEFVWLYENTLDWERIAEHTVIQPMFVGHESLRALKSAARALKLHDSQLEDIFYNNARRLLGIST
jgi:glutamate-1-semialdehyde 2,1-aminomutase